MSIDDKSNEVIIYTGENGQTHIGVKFQGETAWLTQAQLVELFQSSKANVSEHIKNTFDEGELRQDSVVRIFRTTAADGKSYDVNYYNLDMIISLGYRIKSSVATKFRIWATERLREYIVKGFAMDDERLKGAGGGNYWKELLERIRDIRSSEKALYRQVLDLYATSVDYDPNNSETVKFFKVVQNKLHYATNKQTAAEVIHARADSAKDFMGLITFAGAMPILKDIAVAKNYLTEDELFVLNRLVSAFFDLAEIKAREHTPMRMRDWVRELDKFAAAYGKGVLQNAGAISHRQAEEKAAKEYRKYQARTLSPVEEAYLESVKALSKQAEAAIRQSSKTKRATKRGEKK
ncbi:MAG: virulence RhuM family protein [Deltaproteobacteria bacterium]